jgi:lipopolysaccharide biosynthesis glycosyltransferase
MERTRLNILHCCDENYVQHVTVCMTSLAVNNPNSDLNIVCVIRDLTDASRRRIEQTMKQFPNVTLSFAAPNVPDNFPVRVHYTIDTYQRFWVRDFFPHEDKVLYLDPDMVVLDDLCALWETDLTGYVFGAVPIPGSDRPAWFRMPEGTLYCNTGTILFNMPEWDKAGCPQVLIDFTARNGQHLRDADQDTINIYLAGRWKPLDARYNILAGRLGDPNMPRDAVLSPAVVHFSGSNKPWKYDSNPPKKEAYWHYLKQTAFRDYVEPDRTLANVVRHNATRILPAAVKGLLRRLAPAPPRGNLPPRPEARLQ